jgi:hypothetical protein
MVEQKDDIVEELVDVIKNACALGETIFYVTQNHELLSVPEEISKLKATLQVLHIDNNYQLHQLPSTIGDLSKLTWLNVSYNKLTELPQTIGKLIHLTRLHANNNVLECLPLEIRNLKALEELFLENNKLRALPTGVLELPKLATLYIDNNPLLIPNDLVEGLEDKVPLPPPIGECSLTRQRFTECFVHMSFHKLCGNSSVPIVHYLSTLKALELMKTVLWEKYGVIS